MRVLVTGGEGQLGRSLVKCGTTCEVIALPRRELDITRIDDVLRAFDAVQPTCVINAAAYNAVDAAERDPDSAFAVNRDGAEIVARVGAERRVPVTHISTDYVFDGTSTTPLREDAEPRPLGVYGASKLAGEQRVTAAGGTVVRTSWLFADRGPGFVQTILRLAFERPVIEVVDDQRGCPTWADALARALLAMVASAAPPIVHYCGTPAVSRAELAQTILAEARRYRPTTSRIEPIATVPGGARRPASAILDLTRARILGLPLRPWRVGLVEVIASELAS